MCKPGLVFERWTKHLKTDIHAKLSMAFNDGTKVRKTSCFYIIGDTASATECYVFAHGGSFQDLDMGLRIAHSQCRPDLPSSSTSRTATPSPLPQRTCGPETR